MEMIIIVLSLGIASLAFLAGMLTKGIHINITTTKPDTLPVDEEGKPKYNESLVDLLPIHIRRELDEIQLRKGES